EDLRDEVQRLWAVYQDIAKVRRITGLGVRYVNRIDLPGPALNLKEWLLTGPEVAEGMHQNLAGFTMQLLLPQPDLKSTVAVIREAVVAPPKPDLVSVVLDTDVRQTADRINEED